MKRSSITNPERLQGFLTKKFLIKENCQSLGGGEIRNMLWSYN